MSPHRRSRVAVAVAPSPAPWEVEAHPEGVVQGSDHGLIPALGAFFTGSPWSVEGIDPPAFPDPRPATACPRWPEGWKLLNETTGELFNGSCKSTNLCDRCARYYAVETCEMLWLDALEQGSPPLWSILTTSDPVWDGDKYRRTFDHVVRSVRLRWPDAEYAALVEFTTGYGPRSGGLRRPHVNTFWRGVPIDQEHELQRVIASVWCPRMKAAEHQQRVYRVSEDRGGMRGLTRYVSLHFLKESQQPPKGWRGQRFRASRGFFVRPRSVMREEARKALKVRALARALGDPVTAQLEVEHRETHTWRLVAPFTSFPGAPRGGDAARLTVDSSRVAGVAPGGSPAAAGLPAMGGASP